MKKGLMKKILLVVLAFTMAMGMSITAYAKDVAPRVEGDSYICYYEHDPRINAKAMDDIVVNPKAVFGFSPNKASTRLGSYADAIDWSDFEAVMAAQQERIDYLAQFDLMYVEWNKLEKAGKDTETIARTLSAMRNDIRLAAYKDDPEGLAKVKKSNLDTYGNENGPTAESLFEKYGSWEKVLLKCFSSNSGMDACLGLYEVQYEHNLKSGTIVESENIVYTVKKNDSLSKISGNYYGNKNAWVSIYEANKDLILDPNIISEGQLLTIP